MHVRQFLEDRNIPFVYEKCLRYHFGHVWTDNSCLWIEIFAFYNVSVELLSKGKILSDRRASDFTLAVKIQEENVRNWVQTIMEESKEVK